MLRQLTAAMTRRRRLLLRLYLPLLLLHHFAAAETDPSDSAAMAALSKSLDAAGSLRWTGGDACSSWDGVSCDVGRVTAIQLRGRGLAGGTIAPEISKLTSLARLELQGCGLGGPLPSFAGMSALKVLLLSNNSFTAVPPGAFAGATALQAVALDDNTKLAPWPIPDGLRDAAALVNFSANSANVNSTIPAFLGDGFPSLNHLALAYNSLRGGIPASFAGSSIQSLWLNNQVGDGRLSGSLAVLGKMANLVQAWLHVNDFTGPLPDFTNLTSLTELQVRDNKLTGPVPESLVKLPSLKKVLIKNNLLQGPFPAFSKSVETDADMLPADNRFCLTAPGDCDARVNALLSVVRPLDYPAKLADSWEGNDPCNGWFGISCIEGNNISVINFQGMNLSGTISPDFSQFKSLQKLILANNGFVGPIPPELATLPSLKELDVRNNKLTGKIPDFKSVVLQTDGNVGIGQDSPPGEAPNGASPSSNSSGNGSSGGSGGSKSSLPVPAIVGSVVGVVVLIVGGYLVFYYCKRRKSKFGRVQSPHATVIHPRHSGSDQEVVKITVASSASAPVSETMSHASGGPSELHVLETPNMVISIQMLRSVTNNFSDDNILGKGGFGTVYKGELHDGTKIAVKRMEASVVTNKGFDEFKSEVAVLSKVRHRHLVALLGYCLDGNERLLVYEYMPQGTLSRYLFNWGEENLKPLEWKKRLSIALDVARGVEYLHSLAHQSFIHRDLKPSNILLGDDLRAKVSDFGLVRLAPDGKDGKVSVATRLAGTFGYLAPEYAAMGRVTTKVDVFSFGVILMELITGRKAIEETMPEEAVYLVTWFRRMLINKDSFPKAVDPTIDLTEETLASVTTVAELAGHCCAREPQQRPDMGHAVNVLSCLVDVWKPSSANYEDNFGIDLDEPLPVALKKWQALEADTRSMFPTESLDSTQTSLPARPNGFAESFNSSDGR